MAKTTSVLVKKSHLQTLCLVVLLLPLPLLYLLHVHVAREFTVSTRDLHRVRDLNVHSHSEMETKIYRYNTSHSLRSANVRRVLVKNTRRVQSGKMSRTSSVFGGVRKKCKSRICREYLSDKDVGYFGYCWRKTHLKKEPQRSVCRFLNATTRTPIALAGFPGSGNTWVRGLLQQATGICTGGIYCDTTLRTNGYPGESLRSGNTLVVKTHQRDPRWTGLYYPPNTNDSYFTKEVNIPVYDAAIFLIRNPFHALVAEWNRIMTVNMSDNHIKTVDATFFSEFRCRANLTI